jgi:hypothetical protein
MGQSHSWVANTLSASQEIPRPFMEPGSSLPCSEEPHTSLYAEPDESSPHLPTLFP